MNNGEKHRRRLQCLYMEGARRWLEQQVRFVMGWGLGDRLER